MTKTASGLDIIRSAQRAGTLTIGKETSLRALRQGELEYVFASANAPEQALEDLSHYAGLSETKFSQLNVNAEDLGVVCKKQFAVSVVGVRKR